MINAQQKIKQSGLPNYLGEKILLPSRFNFDYLEKELSCYKDRIVIELLKYGFPLGNTKGLGNKTVPKNHTGATCYKNEMHKLLEKEIQCKSVIGPFQESPFGKDTRYSPLNSVPKKDSKLRRLILDLSYPEGNSINCGIDKDWYLGEESKLTLPSMDQLAEQVMKLGPNCKVFKVDLQRGYRQFFVDPAAIPWLAYCFEGKIFLDCSLSMGSRSSARCCQMVTSAVVFIHTKNGYFAINYLDDLGGAETSERAEEAFQHLRQILINMGLQEAASKTVAPCTIMVFLGIEVNTITLTLTIPMEKWEEIQKVLKKWEKMERATKKQVQKLAGLLNFACRCVRSGRIYLSRILNYLRTFNGNESRMVTTDVKKDIEWWVEFAPTYNGVSLMLENDWSSPDEVFSSDSCLSGGGALTQKSFVQWTYPREITKLRCNINQLECLMVVVALKTMGKQLHRKKLVINCDNKVSVFAINSGFSRDEKIQCCLRELHKFLALNHCELKAKFLEGKLNRESDALSRWDKNPSFRQSFYELTAHLQLTQVLVPKAIWEFFVS